ncbi:MAG: hypothetical protein ACLFPF_06945 [Halanaerobiales bacterium]
MSIKIANYQFDGPYTSLKKLENRAGIYVVHCHKDNKYYIIDIGESAMVRNRVERHERMKCWLRHSDGGDIAVSVYYTNHWSQDGRSKFVKKLREEYNPPCGKSRLDSKLSFH